MIINDINIIYNFNKNVRLFGYDFVKNNKEVCKILIDNKEN